MRRFQHFQRLRVILPLLLMCFASITIAGRWRRRWHPRQPGVRIRPTGVAAGRVELYLDFLDGASTDEKVILSRGSDTAGGPDSRIELEAPSDVARPVVIDSLAPGRWHVSFRGERTGQTVTAALPSPPLPARLDGEGLVALRSVNFEGSFLLARAKGVVLGEAPAGVPEAPLPADAALHVRPATAFCPGSSAIVLESCAFPGLVLAHGNFPDARLHLSLPRRSGGVCDQSILWSALSPGLSGDGTVSLVAGQRTGSGSALVARHAFSKLQLSPLQLPVQPSAIDSLLAADASWRLEAPASSQCSTPLSGADAVEKASASMSLSTVRAIMSIEIGGRPATGTLSFSLFGHVAPRTVDNFVQLCDAAAQGGRYQYTGSSLQRVIPGFMVQGGSTDGGYGKSATGGQFADESFVLTHDARGVLSMANAGEDTNGSQFFILFGAQPHLNGKHVVFGRLDDDGVSHAVLSEIEAVGRGDGSTSAPVKITGCRTSMITHQRQSALT